MLDKQTVREKYLKIRKNIIDRDNKNKLITKNVINLKYYQDAKVIAIYKSLADEVNTDEIILDAINHNKTVLLPRVIDNDLAFYQIKSLNETFEKSNFGVLEPISNDANYYSKEKIDLIIVPGIAFDKEGNRLGFGKGYYDRYLVNSNLLSIGICYDEQLTDILPYDDSDVKINAIVTDKEIVAKRILKK